MKQSLMKTKHPSGVNAVSTTPMHLKLYLKVLTPRQEELYQRPVLLQQNGTVTAKLPYNTAMFLAPTRLGALRCLIVCQATMNRFLRPLRTHLRSGNE